MFVISDSKGNDLRHITIISEGTEKLKLYDYILIEDKQKDKYYVGQIVMPNRNISAIEENRYDTSLIDAIRTSGLDDQILDMASHNIFWDVLPLGEYKNGKLLTLRDRPLPGAIGSRLDNIITGKILKLPPQKQYADGTSNVIGILLNADNVPICVNKSIFERNIIINGTVGSGKSNTGGELIYVGFKEKFTPIIFDAKPDYQLMDQPNTDEGISEIWGLFEEYGLSPHGLKVLKVGIYDGPNKDYSHYDKVVGFQSSGFDHEMLAGLFTAFTENQHEEFVNACGLISRNGDSFTLEDVLSKIQEGLDNEDIHKATGRGVLWKVRRRRRNMYWIDSVGKSIDGALSDYGNNPISRNLGTKTRKVEDFTIDSLVDQGLIIHIDVSDLSPEVYAIILSRIVDLSQKYLRDKKRTNKYTGGILLHIDEAHRLWDNESRYRQPLAMSLERYMREGRSLKGAMIMSLQNATQIPPNVMNLFNTHIVMKQNSLDVAKAATQSMGPEFAAQSITLGTGQALVKILESTATVLAQMAPSPFELQRVEEDE